MQAWGSTNSGNIFITAGKLKILHNESSKENQQNQSMAYFFGKKVEPSFVEVVDKSRDIIAVAGKACAASSLLLSHLPAPFSVTGVLFGAMVIQLQKIDHAHGAWKDCYEELEAFQSEIAGELGYAVLFQKCIESESVKETVEEKSLATALREECESMNRFAVELMNRIALTSPKFPDTHFRPDKYKTNAETASKRLKAFREQLRGKVDRYQTIATAKISEDMANLTLKVNKTSCELLTHQKMKELWGVNNWPSTISIDAFVEEVRAHSSCTPELLARFREFLVATTAERCVVELSPLIINDITRGVDASMDLNAVVLAVTPKESTLTKNIAHAGLRKIWLAGEKEKRLKSCDVTVADFNHAILKAYEGAEITIPAKNLTKLLKVHFSSDTVMLGDLAELCVGMDSELSVLDTVKAMVKKLEELAPVPAAVAVPMTPPRTTGPPQPPRSTGSPVPTLSPSSDGYVYLQTSPYKYRADDASPKKTAWCIYCNKQYLTNNASETTKPMITHLDTCPNYPR